MLTRSLPAVEFPVGEAGIRSSNLVVSHVSGGARKDSDRLPEDG
jgi:hypothetical protein